MHACARRALTLLLLACSLAGATCGREDRKKRRQEPAPTPPPTFHATAHHDPLERAAELEGWQKDWWMDKAARALTGRGLDVHPEADALRALGRADYVLRLLEDPAFADQVLKFSVYFLGFDVDSVQDEYGRLRSEVMDMPQALAAARSFRPETRDEGSILNLFKLDQPYYVEPLRPAYSPDQVFDPESPMPDQEGLRERLRTQILHDVTQLRDLALNAVVSKEELCEHFFSNVFSETGPIVLLYYYGFGDSIVQNMIRDERWFGGLISYCFLPSISKPNFGRLHAMVETLAQLFEVAKTWRTDQYIVREMGELLKIDSEPLGLSRATALGPIFYQNLNNSSTNYNRRRSAYILKRYFCDDLIPISVTIPDNHPKDRHESDPSCQSCHYKLDPMAGFFKTRGVSGLDFSEADAIVFDDLATMEREAYESAWRAPPHSGRDWDIGYIRSTEDSSLNSYGETLEDLFAIIASSRESKQCLVKRLLEHLDGENQAFDPGYVNYLTDRFIAELPMDQSGNAAFKRTVARIVLSRTFSEPDLVSGECYDHAPGERVEGGPPCRVAFLFERHCASCHGSGARAAGLDLTSWERGTDGAYSFTHVKRGVPVDRRSTFERLLERLTTTDASRRMPLDKHMPSADREQLVLWLNAELQAMGESQ